MRVLITNLMMLQEQPRFAATLAERGIEAVFHPVRQALTEQELLPLMGSFDGWIAGDDAVTGAVLDRALPRLKVIAKWGTGVDSFDLAAAAQRGVPVFNAPGAFRHAVSEVALGYMLGLSRYLVATDRAVRDGGWPKPCGPGLYGKRVGIVGFGAIGQGVAERAHAFGMQILAHDPAQPKIDAAHAPRYLPLEELLTQSDVLCLCCNMSAENRHMLNAARLALLPEGALVVNVARGGLIDEAALTDALQRGHVGGAGLDVFEVEPLPMESPLRGMENVILGSHNANNQWAAIEAVHERTLACLYQGLGLEKAQLVPVTARFAA